MTYFHWTTELFYQFFSLFKCFEVEKINNKYAFHGKWKQITSLTLIGKNCFNISAHVPNLGGALVGDLSTLSYVKLETLNLLEIKLNLAEINTIVLYTTLVDNSLELFKYFRKEKGLETR